MQADGWWRGILPTSNIQPPLTRSSSMASQLAHPAQTTLRGIHERGAVRVSLHDPLQATHGIPFKPAAGFYHVSAAAAGPTYDRLVRRLSGHGDGAPPEEGGAMKRAGTQNCSTRACMKEAGDETRASGRADAAATERVDARVVLSPGAFDLFAASLEKSGHADDALLRLLRRKPARGP